MTLGDSVTDQPFWTASLRRGLADGWGRASLGLRSTANPRFEGDGGPDPDHGPGGGARLLADGESCSALLVELTLGSVLSDGMSIYFTAQPGGGDAVISIDDLEIDKISTAGAGIVTWSSGALAVGPHTVKIAAPGGPVILNTVPLYDGNRMSGPQLHVGASPGWRLGDLVAHTATFDHLELVDPHLVIVVMGINSCQEATADFRAGVHAIVESIRARTTTAAVLLVAPYRPQGAVHWSDKVGAIRDVAAERDCGFLDLWELLGNLGHDLDPDLDPDDPNRAADPFGLSEDGIHPTSVAGRLMSGAILDVVMPDVHQGLPMLDDGTRRAFAVGMWSAAGAGTLAMSASGELTFTDPAGTEHAVTPRSDRLTADLALPERSGGHVPALSVEIGEDEWLSIDVWLFVGADSADAQLSAQLEGPDGASGRFGVAGVTAEPGNASRHVAADLGDTIEVHLAAGQTLVHLHDAVRSGPSAGSIELRLAPTSSNAEVTIREGSELLARVV